LRKRHKSPKIELDHAEIAQLILTPPSARFINMALSIKSSGSLKNKFLDRTIPSSTREIFLEKGLENFHKNISSLIDRINDNSLLKLEHLEDSDISWYQEFQTLKKVDQNLIRSIQAGDPNRLTLEDRSIIQLSNKELAKILSKNMLNGKRYVYLNSEDSNVNNDEYRVINLQDRVIHLSVGMNVDINENKKQIKFTQTYSKDWALLMGGDYSNWRIFFEGMKSDQTSKDNPGQRFNQFGLTGCLTLYKASVNNSTFELSNGQCEDSINFINTLGTNVYLSVQNAYSDAVDADFSELSFSELKVNGAGNDCLDVSAGNYLLLNSIIKKCSDKAISIGEASKFSGLNVNIFDSNIGVSSKDFSETVIEKLHLNNVKKCGEAKRKKQEFGGATLFIKNSNCTSIFESDIDSRSS